MRMIAKKDIEQSPLSNAPDVPKGRIGTLDDEADDLLWVDFGGPYGTIACDASEVRPSWVWPLKQLEKKK